MKKEYYRAEREFTGKVGTEVPLFEAGWLVWGTVFNRKHRDAPLGFLKGFHEWFDRGNTSAAIQFLFSDAQELSPMDDEKDPHNCSFLVTQAPSSSCLHGKTTLFTFLHFSAGGYAEQSDSVHLLLPKTSSKIHPGKRRRGEGEGPSVSSCCLAMPCPAELHHHLTENPLKQHCFTCGPQIWWSKK